MSIIGHAQPPSARCSCGLSYAGDRQTLRRGAAAGFVVTPRSPRCSTEPARRDRDGTRGSPFAPCRLGVARVDLRAAEFGFGSAASPGAAGHRTMPGGGPAQPGPLSSPRSPRRSTPPEGILVTRLEVSLVWGNLPSAGWPRTPGSVGSRPSREVRPPPAKRGAMFPFIHQRSPASDRSLGFLFGQRTEPHPVAWTAANARGAPAPPLVAKTASASSLASSASSLLASASSALASASSFACAASQAAQWPTKLA